MAICRLPLAPRCGTQIVACGEGGFAHNDSRAMSGNPAPNWDSEGESPGVGIPLDDGLSERLGQGCTPGGQQDADRADENGPEEDEDERAWLQEEEEIEEEGQRARRKRNCGASKMRRTMTSRRN